MKWELTDETLLGVAGASCAVFAAHSLVATNNFHSVHMSKDQPYSEATWRWFGLAAAGGAAHELVLSASEPNKKALKNALVTAGAGNLACAGFTAYNLHEGIQKKETAIANLVVMTALGAACLWRGSKDRD